MGGRISLTDSSHRRFVFSVRPLLLFAHETCQGKMATGSRAVLRLKAALQTVKFYKNPESGSEKKTPPRRRAGFASGPLIYFFLFWRLEALSGFILALACAAVELMCVAMLQLPIFHLRDGSGQDEQYQPDWTSTLRPQPLQFSTISWQIPPLYEQPFAVMKGHSLPSRTVVQIIGITPFE
jgi:hypothetical protein